MDMRQELAAAKAEIERLKNQRSAEKAAKVRPLTCRVAEKSGGVSVYGLHRFPVTLYRSQWERLAGFMPAISAFIEANKAHLSTKGEDEEAAETQRKVG